VIFLKNVVDILKVPEIEKSRDWLLSLLRKMQNKKKWLSYCVLFSEPCDLGQVVWSRDFLKIVALFSQVPQNEKIM